MLSRLSIIADVIIIHVSGLVCIQGLDVAMDGGSQAKLDIKGYVFDSGLNKHPEFAFSYAIVMCMIVALCARVEGRSPVGQVYR